MANPRPDETLFRLLLLFNYVLACLLGSHAQLQFAEVTKQVGIRDLDQDKVSGPSVGDFDQDGYLDIAQSNHAKGPAEVYFGMPDGTFRLETPYPVKGDDHGTAIGDIDNDGYPDLVLSVGGFKIDESRKTYTTLPPRIAKSFQGNLTFVPGRQLGWYGNPEFEKGSMQVVRLVDLDGDGDLDAFCQNRKKNSLYENIGNGRYRNIHAGGLQWGKWLGGALFFDYNKDGNMDALLFGQPGKGVEVWQGNGRFRFVDVTTEVFPRRYGASQFSGAAEFDYDNDGDLDIYLGAGSKRKLDYDAGNDVLLENVGGRYIDVSRKAKIPKGGAHQGITVGDFNNDGWQDIFLPRVNTNDSRIGDIILLNSGSKNFTIVENHGANGPLDGSDLSFPAGAQTFDYDKDGLVDVLVASRRNGALDQAVAQKLEGNLRLFKNKLVSDNNYVSIKVPVIAQNATLMDAVLTLTTPGATFIRRVGSAGEGRAQSFNDQVHFGLGNITSLLQVDILLTTGISVSYDLRGMSVNSEIVLGLSSGGGLSPPEDGYCIVRDPCATWRFYYFLNPGDFYIAFCGRKYVIQDDCSQV